MLILLVVQSPVLTGKEHSLTVIPNRDFLKIFLNILISFILHKTVVFVDKDPAWKINKIKHLIWQKTWFFKTFVRVKKRNTDFFRKLKFLQERLNSLLSFSKEHYYSKGENKLFNIEESSKSCSSLLKTFLNNSKKSYHISRF